MDLTDEELNVCMDAYENASVDNQERVSMSLQTSYWDWLPTEIQEYVTQLATAQYIRDNQKINCGTMSVKKSCCITLKEE